MATALTPTSSKILQQIREKLEKEVQCFMRTARVVIEVTAVLLDGGTEPWHIVINAKSTVPRTAFVTWKGKIFGFVVDPAPPKRSNTTYWEISLSPNTPEERTYIGREELMKFNNEFHDESLRDLLLTVQERGAFDFQTIPHPLQLPSYPIKQLATIHASHIKQRRLYLPWCPPPPPDPGKVEKAFAIVQQVALWCSPIDKGQWSKELSEQGISKDQEIRACYQRLKDLSGESMRAHRFAIEVGYCRQKGDKEEPRKLEWKADEGKEQTLFVLYQRTLRCVTVVPSEPDEPLLKAFVSTDLDEKICKVTEAWMKEFGSENSEGHFIMADTHQVEYMETIKVPPPNFPIASSR